MILLSKWVKYNNPDGHIAIFFELVSLGLFWYGIIHMNLMRRLPFAKLSEFYETEGCYMENLNDNTSEITIAYYWMSIEICVFYA